MSQFSMFDVLGPIMIGPSSSHTAGAARLGRMAAQLCGTDFHAVHFLLHGSFGKTYRGHGTDRALAAGVLGMLPDDERLPEALDIAKEQGIDLTFEPADLGDCHENTAKIIFARKNAAPFFVQGSSVGGGAICITKLDGFETEITGLYPTLVIEHLDQTGVIGEVTTILARADINIGLMRVRRKAKGTQAFATIETDEIIPLQVVKQLQELAAVCSVRVLAPVE